MYFDFLMVSKKYRKSLDSPSSLPCAMAFFFSVFLLKNNVVIFYFQLIFFQLKKKKLYFWVLTSKKKTFFDFGCLMRVRQPVLGFTGKGIV